MKRFLSLLLVVAMLCTIGGMSLAEGYNELLNLDDTYPVTKEPYTLSAVATYDSAITVDFTTGQSFWQILERKSNVQVDWNLIANEAWNEQKAILLAGGDLPDVFFVPFSNAEVYKYGMEQGIMLPLNEYLADVKLTPNINEVFAEKPALKAASVLPDGNIYGLGYYMTDYYETASGIRGQWIKQYCDLAGVDPSQIVTLDDLYEALKQMKACDYNGDGIANEEPLSYYTTNSVVPAWDALIQYVMNAYGYVYDGGVGINTRDGSKCGYAPLTAEFKLALEYLNKLYTEQLLDNATFTQTEADYQAKGVNGQVALSVYYNCYAVVPTDIVAAHTENNYKNEVLYSPRPVVDDAANIPVVNGDYGIGVNRVSLSAACKNPDIAMNWLDCFFTPQNNLYFRSGPESGSEDDIINNGWTWDPEITDFDASEMLTRSGIENGWYMWITVVNFAMGSVGYLGSDNYRGMAEIHPDVMSKAANDWLTPYREAINEYEVPGYPGFAVYYSAEQQEFVDTYVTDIQTYAFSNAAKFITGAKSFAEYNEYIDGLKALQAEEYDAMLSEIYAAFASNN
jgi:putative aldouronate transport system substrate-binding protein